MSTPVPAIYKVSQSQSSCRFAHLLGQHAERLGGTGSSCISLAASNIARANPNESSSAEQEKALEKERDREN